MKERKSEGTKERLTRQKTLSLELTDASAIRSFTPSLFRPLFLLLGANLGDRILTLRQAINLIGQRVGTVRQASDLYETAPWGLTNQPAFLNQIVVIETSLPPEEVLQKTQAIENELGRIRLEKWGARAIDIDILYYDQLVLQSDNLTIPHPYLHQRRFTLVPLAQVAHNFVHPILQKTSTTLLRECTDDGKVTLFAQDV